MLVLGPDFHFFEAVAGVGGIQFVDGDRLWIIRLNRNHSNAAILVVRRKLRDTLLIHLRDRTMVADEHHYEDLACGVVGELMSRSVDAREFEVWRRRTQREDRMRFLRPRGQRKRYK